MKDLELRDWLGDSTQGNMTKIGLVYMGVVFVLALVAVKLFT